MKLKDLLNKKIKNSYNGINAWNEINMQHFEDVRDVFFAVVLEDFDIRVDQFVKSYSDYRRFWELGAFYYKDELIFIYQNAGREGDDFSNKYVINVKMYLELLHELQKLIPLENYGSNLKEEYKLEDDIEGLDEFYGCDLERALTLGY